MGRRRLSRKDRKWIALIRENMAALGVSLDDLSDEGVAEEVQRFGTLAGIAGISTPEVAEALQAFATGGVSVEDAAVPNPAGFSVEDAAIPSPRDRLVLLRGGPMDGVLVPTTAPALNPYWSAEGRYEPAGRDQAGNQVADWAPRSGRGSGG